MFLRREKPLKVSEQRVASENTTGYVKEHAASAYCLPGGAGPGRVLKLFSAESPLYSESRAFLDGF